MLELPVLNDARLTCQQRVAELTFERDDVRNALTGTTLVEDILLALEWCNSNEDVSVLILTGKGSAFSAGGNIKDMRDRSGMFSGSVQQIQQNYRRGIQQLPLAFQRSEVVVVAAVNGPAIGAGMDLACMCDLRYASDLARFGETFLNLGIVPGDGGAWFLPRLIGVQKASELIFTGRIISAEEAKSIGLVLDAFAPGDLLNEVRKIAASIAAQPPAALRLSKRLLKLSEKMDLPEYLDLCACFQGMAHHSEDHFEAVNAFIEKRMPLFCGK